jgi:hypothetical protein
LRQLEEEDTWLHQGAVELLPATEGRFRDAHLAAHLGYLRSALGLLKANAICCSVNFDFFIGQPPFQGFRLAGFSHLQWSNFRGRTQA